MSGGVTVLLAGALALGGNTTGTVQAKTQEAGKPADVAGVADTASDDIVVTAQRRSERLQDVPIAISAMDEKALSSRGVVDVADLRGVIPSLSISTFAGVNASNLLSIRGITGQPLPIGAGQAVAIYLDGVYLARPDAGFFALDDLERIEVLRGPQGTLYGRNATAGAINIITREPGNDPAMSFDVSTGNYGSVTARASLSGPLGGGFAAGVSAAYDRGDGWFTNTLDGTRLGGKHSSTLRGKLRYASPSGNFDATLTGDLENSNGEFVTKSLLNGSGSYVGIGDPALVTTDIGDRIGTVIKSHGASFVANLEVSPSIKITSITGYRDVHTDTAYDGDGSAAPIFYTVSANTSKTFNQELRGVLTGSRVRATIGANYFHEEGSFGLNVGGPSLPPLLKGPFDTTTLDAYAAFGQIEFDIRDNLTVVGGLRFNREARDFAVDYRQSRTPGNFTSGRITDNALLPSIGINFKAAPDVLLYAKASKGYLAPGFNFAPGATTTLPNTFDAEKLWAYEVGAKTQLFDRRVTLNMAGFYYDYRDVQVRSVIGPGVTNVANAATATAKGIEAELEVRPVRGLRLGGHVTYLDAGYNDFCETLSAASPVASNPLCAPGIANRSGNRLNQAPKWSGGVNAGYEADLGDGWGLNASLSYSFESKVYFTTANEMAASNDGWSRLDARLGLKAGRAEVYLFGRNLTNRRYLGQIYRLSPTVLFGSVSDPRLYGIGLRYRY